MTKFQFAALAAGLLTSASLTAPLAAKPVSYPLPNETAAFRPGPGADTAQNNCTSCHSADYVLTQPRGAKFGAAFWAAEVTKMVKVYGAPIDEAEAKKIVDYLTAAYAK